MQYYGTRLSENISRRFRSLNRRNSALRSLLVSADLTSFGISATGGRKRFAPRAFGLNYSF